MVGPAALISSTRRRFTRVGVARRTSRVSAPSSATRPSPTPTPDALAREAVDLVVLLMSGEATTADAARIRTWRASSPAHEAAFAEVVRTWRGLREAIRATSDDRLGSLDAAKPIGSPPSVEAPGASLAAIGPQPKINTSSE